MTPRRHSEPRFNSSNIHMFRNAIGNKFGTKSMHGMEVRNGGAVSRWPIKSAVVSKILWVIALISQGQRWTPRHFIFYSQNIVRGKLRIFLETICVMIVSGPLHDRGETHDSANRANTSRSICQQVLTIFWISTFKDVETWLAIIDVNPGRQCRHVCLRSVCDIWLAVVACWNCFWKRNRNELKKCQLHLLLFVHSKSNVVTTFGRYLCHKDGSGQVLARLCKKIFDLISIILSW